MVFLCGDDDNPGVQYGLPPPTINVNWNFAGDHKEERKLERRKMFLIIVENILVFFRVFFSNKVSGNVVKK